MKKNQMVILVAVLAIAVVAIVAVLLMMGGGQKVEAIVCQMDSSATSGTMSVTEGKVKIDMTVTAMGASIQVKALVTGNDAYINMPSLGNTWYRTDIASIPGMDPAAMEQFRSKSMEELKAEMGSGGPSCSVIQVPASDFELPAGASVQQLPAGAGGLGG